MYKDLLIIVMICMSVCGQKSVDSLSVTVDPGEIFAPDPGRIAHDRIQMIRLFEMENGLPQMNEVSDFQITLDDAIQKLIVHNNEIKKAQMEFLIGEKRFYASFGAFEPYLTGNYDYSEAQHPNTILTETRESLQGGVEGLLPTGTQYGYSLTQKDILYAQNSLEWPEVISVVTLTQPLLKNFLWNSPFTDIKMANAERQIAYHRYRSTLIAQCYNLENTYWKLAYLQEKRRNAEKSVAIALQIVNENRTFVASGIMSKLDAVEVTSELAQRKITLSSVKMEHMDAMNGLMQMIGFTSDSALIPLRTVTPLLVNQKDQIPDSLSLEAINGIISNCQPDLLSEEYARIRSRVAVSQQRGKALPELNLTYTQGISGSNKIFDYAVDQFLDSERNKQNWACGVELRVLLGTGIRERNLLEAEKLNLKIAEIKKESLKNELTSQSVLTVRRIHDLIRNLSSAAVVVKYRTSLMQSELVRLHAGLSNVRKIFELEQDLANARERELEMRVQYLMTLSLYDRLLGVTLSKRGLEEMVDGKPVLNNKLIRK